VGFPHLSRPALQPTQPPTQWVLDFSWGQSCWGVAMTTHPHLGWRLKMDYNYTSTLTLCLHGTLYSELYFLLRRNMYSVALVRERTIPIETCTVQLNKDSCYMHACSKELDLVTNYPYRWHSIYFYCHYLVKLLQTLTFHFGMCISEIFLIT
jgi:hypothetical protein